jgi:hypothetical protein
MREYSMEYPAVLRLPLRTFWSLNRQVDRLRAEAEQRLLRLHSAAEHPEAVKSLSESLVNSIGTPVLYEKKFDADKFDELRKKLKKPRAGRVATETHTE